MVVSYQGSEPCRDEYGAEHRHEAGSPIIGCNELKNIMQSPFHTLMGFLSGVGFCQVVLSSCYEDDRFVSCRIT